jgi:hypothetical protein
VVISREPGPLKGLLQRLADGIPHATGAMGRDLGVSEETLGRMIGDLARLGYLQIVEAARPDRCDRCPLVKTCGVPRVPRVWMITDRGRRAATREAG